MSSFIIFFPSGRALLCFNLKNLAPKIPTANIKQGKSWRVPETNVLACAPGPATTRESLIRKKRIMSELDELSINALRFLAVDAVEKAKSGHPGAPLGDAPMAYLLFHKIMRHNPANARWSNRDRFRFVEWTCLRDVVFRPAPDRIQDLHRRSEAVSTMGFHYAGPS